MAVEWIGGIPEEELERCKNHSVKKDSSAQANTIHKQREFLSASEPLTQFCKMMWERKGQPSSAAQNVVEDNTSARAYKKGAMFKM